MVYDPRLGKTSEDFRFIFTDRKAIGKKKKIAENKKQKKAKKAEKRLKAEKSRKSEVTLTPGERKALRSKT